MYIYTDTEYCERIKFIYLYWDAQVSLLDGQLNFDEGVSQLAS